jgi:hypothetical protein
VGKVKNSERYEEAEVGELMESCGKGAKRTVGVCEDN